MRITYFSNYKDTSVNMFDDASWSDICKQFKVHEIQDDKDGLMFNLCEFRTLTDEFSNYRENRTDIRCADNVISYHGLILDYDGNGADLSTIMMRFDGFAYLGYTSYRHIINDEGVQKFRIVFPFETPCPKEEWELRKENFLEFAGPEIDRSCVSHSRSFYTPACPPAGVQYKDAWSVDGVFLDWQMFTPITKPVYKNDVVIPLAVSDLQKALDELKKHRPILPNEDRYWIVRAVAKHVGPQQAITECRSRWPDAAYNGKYELQVRKLKSDGPGMGSIVFEIRKYNPQYQVMSPEEFKLASIKQEIQQKYGDQQ